MQKSVSTIGNRFGSLVVLEEFLKKTNGGKRKKSCYCVCDCGTKKWVRQSSLIHGDTKSCGCLQSTGASVRAKQRTGPKIDRSGQRFGLLVATKEWRREKSGCSYVIKWKCRCDCGVEKWIQSYSLTKIKSCGCLHRQETSERKKLEPGVAACNRIFQQYKLRAKKKNIDFELDIEMFKKITSKPCYYCGSGLSNESIVEGNNGSFIYNGIDRKDNVIGYKELNIVPCCKTCNRAKATLTISEFAEWVNNLSKGIYKWAVTY